MSTFGVERYQNAHGDIIVKMDAGSANRVLLALERLDEESGLEPSLAQSAKRSKLRS